MITYATVKVFSSGNAVRVQPEGLAPGQSYSSGNFIIIPEKISSPASAHGFIEFKSNAPGIESFRVHSGGIQNSGGTVLGANQAAVQTALDSLFFLTSGGGGGGAVDSVNGLTGAVVLDPDDLDDSATTNKFVNEASVNSILEGVTAKNPPVDADTFSIIDSAGGSVLSKVTWANIKTALTTLFNTAYVALTGAQTVAGVKTFSDIPVLPGSNPTTDNQAARKLYVDSIALQPMVIPFSDEDTTAITTGVGKISFPNPTGITLTELPYLYFANAPSGSGATIDINVNGVSILSTKLTSNTGANDSTGATPPVLTTTTIASKAVISIDVDEIGTGAFGGKVILVGIVTV